MATQYDTQIQQLYVAYFNRPADATGIAFWANFMANGGTVAQVSAAFAQSLEYQVEYSQSTNAGIVSAVYQNLFGRPAETEGLAFWVKALNDRSITVDNMVEFISRGAQGTDKVAFDSKVVVATAFTNALDTDAEKAGYSGADANEAAKELLAGIKTAANATAAIAPAALNAHVEKVIKAATPFTLESGLQALSVAQAGVADFLKNAEIVGADGKADEAVTEADIAANAVRAEAEVAKLITVGTYIPVAIDNNGDGDTTDAGDTQATLPGVKTALIAEQKTKNAADLTAANTAQTTAQTAVNGVTGLNTAVVTAVSAQDAFEAADEAQAVAAISATAALDTFERRNATSTIDETLDADGNPIITVTGSAAGAEAVTVAVYEGGAWEVAEGVTAADYVGLTALINARNEFNAASLEANAAEEGALDAMLAVAYLDRTTATTDALKLVPFASDEGPTPTAGAVPTMAQLRAEWNALREEETGALTPKTDAFIAAVSGIVTVYEADTTTKGAALIKAEAATEAVQDRIDALTDATEYFDAAKALVTELKGLNADLKEAQDDFTANDYTAPTMVTGTKFATAGSDIFVFDDVSASITSFGRSGEDVLFVGSGFTLNEGAVTTGDNAVLEVFFTQRGNNAVITIETEAYGSDLAEGAGVHTITLNGVNIADLTFENGIITL